ncbi:MAG: LamG-like jellyroll fold domain-containing protein, partial [Candidatus Micrarchaeaceae archaeon]
MSTGKFKSQSAMEYLMTYGWAILIIAVVLAALFELGVFNPLTFAPKASPGSCQVVRPEGAGTTIFMSLSGECNGDIPQYVAEGTGQIAINKEFLQNDSFTILGWVYWPSGTDFSSFDHGYAWSGPNVGDEGFGIFERSDLWYLNFYGDDLQCSDGPVTGKWYQFGASWNNTTKLQTIWVNGAANCTRTSTGYLVTGEPLYLLNGAGTWDNGGGMGGGYASNIQLYNTPLSTNDIKALYTEGVGGAPIKIQSLVGWWPFNGNANDYSGNGNNGVPSGIIYT